VPGDGGGTGRDFHNGVTAERAGTRQRRSTGRCGDRPAFCGW
jgi:hypothetical protein